MSVDALVETLVAFENAADIANRIQLLSRLKSEAIGHVEKKELLVVHGILDIMCRLLQNQAKSRGKQPSQSNGLQNGHPKIPRPWTQEDELTLQSVLLLTSLANEGPAFVAPMLAGETINILVSLVSPAESARSKITVAALKALHAIAAASRLTNPTAESFVTSPSSDALYAKSAVQDLALILADKSHAPVVQTKLSLVCQLIKFSCNNDQRRAALLDGGVLDLLAARLAAYRVHEVASPAKFSSFPAAALLPPTTATLGHILGALVSIIDDSQFRAVRLLFSPAVIGCFPFVKSNNAYDHSLNTQNYTALEALLPRVQPQKPESEAATTTTTTATAAAAASSSSSKAFPPYGAHDTSKEFTVPLTESRQMNAWARESESAMIPWLFHIVKSHRGLTRVQAANLLAEFDKIDVLSPLRQRLLDLLVIPVLMNSDDTLAPSDNNVDGGNPGESSMDLQYAKELTRFVLAKPISHKESLQKFAKDTYVTRQICQTIRDTFEPLQILAPVWTPSEDRENNNTYSKQDLPNTRTLGLPGLRPELANMYREREGALLLMAAVTSSQDDIKRHFTDAGMTHFLCDLLKPFDQQALQAAEKSEQSLRRNKLQVTEFGNPDAVIIAACKAIQSLSRSVALMRTDLIDSGIVKPILDLLRHPNVDVLNAATDVVCNIDVEFSPMRQELFEAQTTKILCQHAHSADSEIRLRSIWALKHMVMSAPYEIQTSCLEELGTGWIVQIVTKAAVVDPLDRNHPNSSSSGMPAANAAGEQINILNTSEVTMSDAQEPPAGQEAGASLFSSGEEMAMKLLASSSAPGALSALTADERTIRTQAFEEAQWKQIWAPMQMEEKIQLQVLDLIRNTMLPPVNVEMVDYYFQTLGASCVFDIVLDKLKSSPVLQHAAVMLLVHISAGTHRHKQQILSQPAILQSVITLLSHPHPLIRRGVCFLVMNILYTEDSSDIPSAKLRATELRKFGFEEALKSRRNDENVDVRERSKTAVTLFSTLLDGSNGDASASAR